MLCGVLHSAASKGLVTSTSPKCTLYPFSPLCDRSSLEFQELEQHVTCIDVCQVDDVVFLSICVLFQFNLCDCTFPLLWQIECANIAKGFFFIASSRHAPYWNLLKLEQCLCVGIFCWTPLSSWMSPSLTLLQCAWFMLSNFGQMESDPT